MATAFRRFQTQVLRHDEGSYEALPMQRCESSPDAVFGWKKLDDDGVHKLRQSVAADLCYLMERHRRNKQHNGRSIYTMRVKVFEQLCEVIDDKVKMKKKTGGDIIVNPSDADATFCGHKGAGYQAQISETCSPDNEVQLVTVALVETAAAPDSKTVSRALDHYEDHGDQPDPKIPMRWNGR